MKKIVLGFSVGLAGGICLATFLRSKKGQQACNNFRDVLENAIDSAKEKLVALNERVCTLIDKSNQISSEAIFKNLTEE